MRKIKYRAWDKRTSEMVKVLGYLEPRFIVCDGRREYERYGANLVLMQYTGVNDKNGVEIYEGDIVSTDLKRPYLIVEFRNGAFMYNCNDGEDDYYDYMAPPNENINISRYLEVIGNIYEDPELLRGKGR